MKTEKPDPLSATPLVARRCCCTRRPHHSFDLCGDPYPPTRRPVVASASLNSRLWAAFPPGPRRKSVANQVRTFQERPGPDSELQRLGYFSSFLSLSIVPVFFVGPSPLPPFQILTPRPLNNPRFWTHRLPPVKPDIPQNPSMNPPRGSGRSTQRYTLRKKPGSVATGSQSDTPPR